MGDREIRGRNGLIIGHCRDLGESIQAIHIGKGFCGRYVKPCNTTFDGRGNRYCFGDGTESLIRDKENE